MALTKILNLLDLGKNEKTPDYSLGFAEAVVSKGPPDPKPDPDE